MRAEDRDVVLAIVEGTGMFTPEEIFFAKEQMDLYLDRPDQKDYILTVVENEENKVVGYISYGPTPMAEGGYDIYWMAVAPGEQGRGYGKELVQWVEGRVTEAGGRMILMETSSQPKYRPTQQFYMNMEYKELCRIPDYYKPGDDRITYGKYFAKEEAKNK